MLKKDLEEDENLKDNDHDAGACSFVAFKSFPYFFFVGGAYHPGIGKDPGGDE